MFKKIVEFFTGKKTESNFAHPLDAVTTPNVSAPYKVPEPAATTPVPLIPEAAQPEKKPAVKKPAVKKPAAMKPSVKKTAAPRKPRTPKQ